MDYKVKDTQVDVGMGASNEKVEEQNTVETFHGSMIRQATQENKEKLLVEVKKVVLKSLLDRKVMVREMERLDAQISAHDAKLEQLTTLVEAGEIIEASEVRNFMQGGNIMFVGVDMGKDIDTVLATLPNGRITPVKRSYPRV